MVCHGKKRIRFGSRDKKKILDFVDPNKDPRSYLRRYITEVTYKDWFNRNYPDYTIYEAVGLSELDYDEIKKKFAPEQEEISATEQPEPEPESEEKSQASGHQIPMDQKMHHQLNHQNHLIMNQ